jgi:site-specific DNA-methyltransferase (adenine-specific)/adenine-specific DNA-methyltransferase
LVKHFSPLGGLVVVPFGGSGSECVAAQTLGRRFVAFEINADYCKIAMDRLVEAGWDRTRNSTGGTVENLQLV